MIKLNIDLTNDKVWKRRGDGAYPYLNDPIYWLADRHCHYIISDEGRQKADSVGYNGYRYGSNAKFRTVPGTFLIVYTYGDMRKGPDAHHYSDPHRTYGPIMGHYIFDDADSDLAMLFKLTWL